MAKQIVMFNLKNDVSEEEYLKWVKTQKAPAQLAVDAGKRFSMLKAVGCEKGDGRSEEHPENVESPFKYCVIMDVTSLEDWGKGIEGSKELLENIFPTWITQYVSDFMALDCEDLYDKVSE